MGLTELTQRENLKLTTLEYSIESEGHFLSEPIVELFARDADGNRRMIEVEGFYPFFYITEDEYQEHESDIFTESMVRSVTAQEFVTSKDNIYNDSLEETDLPPRTTLEGENLVRIETVVPSNVSDMRDYFDRTWEADVFFTNRFLIESGIKDGFSIPAGEDRVDFSEIQTADPPDVDPRVVTIDIEVWSGGEFPDTQNAVKPITAVTVHDSYDDEYYAAVLHPDSANIVGGTPYDSFDWGDISWKLPDGVEECPVEVYQDEAQMLGFVNNWIIDKDPDLLTGWNSSRNEIGSGFDYPYWINRCEQVNEWTYKDLSYENGKTFVTNRGSPVVGGREMFDMLQAYKKTQIHEKRSYSLGYIAEDELGYGKEDVADLDEGWLQNPVDFVEYNIRDVQAVVEIEDVKNVLDMYDHIRSITGGTYSEIADSNIGIIDLLFLRQAKEKGYALPTSVRPEVQHYWGAYVFPPVAGKHKNVVYPDLSSLYPNLFKDMNASPETIVGFEEDLHESPYEKHQCHEIYVDTRDEDVKRSADEPERTELYVLKPEVQTSFVRDVISDLIDMKYEYKKDEYADEAYEAVKRITNSVYGVMGDSVSYGKGFRLFDWRIAEAITLAGRDVIKHTASTFEEYVQKMGYDESAIIAGDTDSCVLEMPQADGSWDLSPLSEEEREQFFEANPELDESRDTAMSETLAMAMDAAEYTDSTYDDFMYERFGIEDGNMAVEIESYAASALFMNKKKRYAQWIRWDEGDLEDEVEYKGFELVRSDSAPITADVQKEVLRMILQEDEPQESVRSYLKENWDAVVSGDVSLGDIGKPSAISSDIWTYGYSEQDDGSFNYYTPQPHIRGQRYANAYIDGEDMDSGKPLMFYARGIQVTSDLPETYSYDNKLKADEDEPRMVEADRPVDAVAVEDVRRMPEAVLIDWEKMAEKTLRDPIEPIAQVMGWDFNDLTTEGKQSGLSQFM
jgi:DNA polymerase I